MEEDAVRIVQRDGHIPATDGPGTHECDEEIRNLIMFYVDDVVIATPTLEDHIESLYEVFTCMKQAGLKCKPSMCEILRDSIKYLGRLVDKHGVRPEPDWV